MEYDTPMLMSTMTSDFLFVQNHRFLRLCAYSDSPLRCTLQWYLSPKDADDDEFRRKCFQQTYLCGMHEMISEHHLPIRLPYLRVRFELVDASIYPQRAFRFRLDGPLYLPNQAGVPLDSDNHAIAPYYNAPPTKKTPEDLLQELIDSETPRSSGERGNRIKDLISSKVRASSHREKRSNSDPHLDYRIPVYLPKGSILFASDSSDRLVCLPIGIEGQILTVRGGRPCWT